MMNESETYDISSTLDQAEGKFNAYNQEKYAGITKQEKIQNEKFRVTAYVIYEPEGSEEHTMNIITDFHTISNLVSVLHNDFRNRPEAKQLKITITKEN